MFFCCCCCCCFVVVFTGSSETGTFLIEEGTYVTDCSMFTWEKEVCPSGVAVRGVCGIKVKRCELLNTLSRLRSRSLFYIVLQQGEPSTLGYIGGSGVLL